MIVTNNDCFPGDATPDCKNDNGQDENYEPPHADGSGSDADSKVVVPAVSHIAASLFFICVYVVETQWCHKCCSVFF